MAEFNLDKMAEKMAEKALDEFICNGKTIREWIEIIVAQDSLAIDELEKLKAEIKQQGSIHVKYRRTEDVDHLVDSIVYQCKDGFCNYIDNSIKKLRGENNE